MLSCSVIELDINSFRKFLANKARWEIAIDRWILIYCIGKHIKDVICYLCTTLYKTNFLKGGIFDSENKSFES